MTVDASESHASSVVVAVAAVVARLWPLWLLWWLLWWLGRCWWGWPMLLLLPLLPALESWWDGAREKMSAAPVLGGWKGRGQVSQSVGCHFLNAPPTQPVPIQ